ncbi:uncharacterized protein CLUP02_05628 [Colletotrichum lupini]|uniref:Uncharacterized protein n=1 Tax=Colletotrichum lupini TaxID=145971 RepID=A0A9Q8SMK2_9PEZI|nr:uncharacterized protein CLUP02_05628 [Colletotrichum lupini]UQC80146.1 hypothetical protein CLUP02_05628 [Colletotrichum lupini]
MKIEKKNKIPKRKRHVRNGNGMKWNEKTLLCPFF